MLIRTVLGASEDEPADAQAAVAHSILNRVGKDGDLDRLVAHLEQRSRRGFFKLRAGLLTGDPGGGVELLERAVKGNERFEGLTEHELLRRATRLARAAR
jgi:hypothetical protein